MRRIEYGSEAGTKRWPAAGERLAAGERPAADRRGADGLLAETDGFSRHGEVPIHLYDQASLAKLLGISKKTVQNLYSRTPHLLPPAIDIPGARGPRWTAPSIIAWLEGRPVHTSTPAPVMVKRSVGRPRIAGRKKD